MAVKLNTYGLASAASNIIVGSVLLWLRSSHIDAACNVPFLTWALVSLSFEFVQAGVTLVTGCMLELPCWGTVIVVLQMLLASTKVAVLIWGTCIAFCNNLWMDHLNGNPEVLAACPNSVYIPFAVFLIASWLTAFGQGYAKIYEMREHK